MSSLAGTYKGRNPFTSRHSRSAAALTQYPSKVPIIIERNVLAKANSSFSDLPQETFVERDVTLAQLAYLIRRRAAGLQEKDAIFLFVHDELPVMRMSVGECADMNKDEDGWLYLVWSSENTFG